MTTVLEAKKRETGKRSTLTQLRKDGQLAAVLYGYQVESIPISLEYKKIAKAVQTLGYTSVLTIDLDGKKVNAVLTDIQRCALKGHVKHVDLLAINMKEELEVEVPIHFVGEAFGVKDGGVLMHPNTTLKIKVKPADMPDSIEIDVSHLAVGDTLSLESVRDRIGFDVVNDDDYTLATVTPPSSTAEATDPEVTNITTDDIEATGQKSDADK